MSENFRIEVNQQARKTKIYNTRRDSLIPVHLFYPEGHAQIAEYGLLEISHEIGLPERKQT